MTLDLKSALRSLRNRPTFFLAAVLTLGLGFGAALATFDVVDRLLLRPMNYPDQERMVFVTGVLPGDSGPGASLSFTEIADISGRAKTISTIAGYADSRPLEVAADSGPRAAQVNFVNTAYFDVLGMRPSQGRLLDRSDEQAPGKHAVAVVSDAFWRAHLGARANAVGSALRIGDIPYTVVGVVDPSFRDISFEMGLPATEVWLSSVMSVPAYGPTFLSSRASRIVWAVGRLADGVTLEQSRAELDTIAADLEREFPDTNRRVGLHIERLDLWLFRDARAPFFTVLAGALALLAVAALNVTGLLVVRMTERARDLVVRRALGASTVQLIRPAIAEAVIVVGLAATAGAGVAAMLLGAVRTNAPYAFPRLQNAGIDARGIVVLAVLSLAAIAVLAIATVMLARWRSSVLVSASRTVTANRWTINLQRALVASEVALAVVLLVGSVLVVQSIDRLDRAPLGFNADRLAATTMELRGERFVGNPSVATFGRKLLDEVRAVPGVQQAFLWGPGRPGHDTWISYVLPERLTQATDPDRVMVWRHSISAGALQEAGIPIISGREFRTTDVPADPFVAVISRSMAERFWPGADPVGQRFTLITTATPRPWFQVIGVAADAAHRRRTYSLRLPEYDYYQLYDQRPERTLTLVTRSAAAPESVLPQVREAVRRADGALPIRNQQTFATLLAEEEASFRFAGGLLSGFAALTFMLSAAGLYALVSYVITLRRRELALRNALGATRGRLFSGLVSTGVRLGAIGIVTGIAVARASAQLLGDVLYGVDPGALPPYVGAGFAMLVIVAIATAIPAGRVKSIDPATALREQL